MVNNFQFISWLIVIFIYSNNYILIVRIYVSLVKSKITCILLVWGSCDMLQFNIIKLSCDNFYYIACILHYMLYDMLWFLIGHNVKKLNFPI